MVVEFDHLPERRLFARPHELEAGPVDDQRIRLFQVLDRAQHHAGCDADEGRMVDAKQCDLLQEPIACVRNR
jgi:hypothetical protein